MDKMNSSGKSVKESFDEAIRQLERLQAQFMNGSLPMDMGDLSEALKNQLEFIAKLNADMALEARSQQPNSAAGTPKRVMQSDPVGNDAVGRLHVGNVYSKAVDMSKEQDIDIEKVEVAKKEITPLAKRLAPALANVQKSVQVPVRQRTAQTRVAHAPEKKLTFLLPETPIESRRLEEQQSLMTPRVLGVGIDEEGIHDVDASTTPGVKAGTPMAIEVLTNLYSLGLQEGRMGMVNDYVDGEMASGQGMKGSQGNGSNSNKTARAAAAAATRRQRSKKGGPKTCNCKRSKCLKMYCECFAASGFCLPGCSCLGCKNTEENAHQVDRARQGILMKDPAAFDDKVNKEEGHKKGCRCKRSKCLKKYCECYNAGVKCNPAICQCVDCCNEPRYRKDKKQPQLEPLVNSMPSSTDLDVEGVVEEKATALQPKEGDENANPINDMFSGEALAFLTPGRCGDDVKSNPVIPGDVTSDAENVLEESKKKNLVENCEVPGSLTFKPDSSALVSHFSPALPEMEDTATSPEYKIGGVKKAVSKAPTARRMTSVVSIPPSVRENLELPSSGGSKRPRRAASGGVSGAIAAARADWGLDHISPPLKRATSVPDKVEKSKGTAAASKKERNALLRKVLQQENGPATHGQEDEADAISALVSLNSMG